MQLVTRGCSFATNISPGCSSLRYVTVCNCFTDLCNGNTVDQSDTQLDLTTDAAPAATTTCFFCSSLTDSTCVNPSTNAGTCQGASCFVTIGNYCVSVWSWHLFNGTWCTKYLSQELRSRYLQDIDMFCKLNIWYFTACQITLSRSLCSPFESEFPSLSIQLTF